MSVDPTPLTAVVLVDTRIGGRALRRFSDSIVSLSSAFTAADEVAIYRFDKFIAKLSGFTNNQEELEKSLVSIHKMSERMPEISHEGLVIFPGRGPRWLRWLLDMKNDTRLLNDAVFTAAKDLEKRGPDKRNVIIAISDGQEAHSMNRWQETRDRLVRDQIQFYAVTIALPLLDRGVSIL
ncbi:MAG TPA: hypothetical protein VM260_05205, partial [Pirellula sp.]|nr:hypothetical protein [Pirellula sp.]